MGKNQPGLVLAAEETTEEGASVEAPLLGAAEGTCVEVWPLGATEGSWVRAPLQEGAVKLTTAGVDETKASPGLLTAML